MNLLDLLQKIFSSEQPTSTQADAHREIIERQAICLSAAVRNITKNGGRKPDEYDTLAKVWYETGWAYDFLKAEIKQKLERNSNV